MKAFLAGYELNRDPGASYEYSNLAVGLLGYALAQSEKTTYGDLVARKIFKPLGMTMSGIGYTNTMRAHRAPGFNQESGKNETWDLAALAGAGGIRSSVADMMRYLKANMGVTKTPLSAAMKTAQEPRRAIGNDTKIGLTWMTRSKPDEGGAIVWHNGMTGGYASFLGFTPDGHRGVVILTNIDFSVDDLGFAALLPNAKLGPAYKPVTLPAAMLDQYVGTYKLSEKINLKINRGGDHLISQATGQSPSPIFARAPDEFFAKGVPGTLSFTRGADGSVTGLVVHQKGDHAAPKLGPADLPDEPKAIAIDPATLQDYVGKFELRPGTLFDVTLADGQLAVQFTGQSVFPVYPSAKDKFFYKVVDAQIDFERDPCGAVTALVLHQGGRNLRAPRSMP